MPADLVVIVVFKPVSGSKINHPRDNGQKTKGPTVDVIEKFDTLASIVIQPAGKYLTQEKFNRHWTEIVKDWM